MRKGKEMIDRVTLDDLFPRAMCGDEPIEGLFLCGFTDACWVCGRSTYWVTLSFEAHVCSMICDDLGWLRFWRADAEAARADHCSFRP